MCDFPTDRLRVNLAKFKDFRRSSFILFKTRSISTIHVCVQSLTKLLTYFYMPELSLKKCTVRKTCGLHTCSTLMVILCTLTQL